MEKRLTQRLPGGHGPCNCDPQSGWLVSPKLGIWVLPIFPVRGRQMTLYYTFDERVVRLLSTVAFDD